ncbi:CvpA family protein [Clostridium sp. D2Q-11]|uniref:CvpA family protein n=1 Tax=Anaeromonas frigoriresistens TaxID=2683708 RepID=A0A942UR16_9FIRM|nr:CvpA family protein [Anaeromonas frigoriresistens]MBS4536983.1 CvpA family protein [Anaeromonas frigoriresistens]
MTIVDIIIIIIIVLTGLEGFNKGFILSAFSLLGTIIALLIAKQYYHLISSFLINNTNIYIWLYKRVFPKISSIVEGEGSLTLDTLLKIIKIPEILINNDMQGIDYSSAQILSDIITILIINIIGIIVIFIIANILLSLIVTIVNIFFKLPLLNSFNKLSGLLFGLIKGVLMIFIIYAILTPIISLNPDGLISTQTTNSVLGNYFYNNNIIIGYLEAKGWNY